MIPQVSFFEVNRLYRQHSPEFSSDSLAGGAKQFLPKGVYFSFGLGPRTCISNGFAQMEAQLILATIAQQFRLQQLNEARLQPSPNAELCRAGSHAVAQDSKR